MSCELTTLHSTRHLAPHSFGSTSGEARLSPCTETCSRAVVQIIEETTAQATEKPSEMLHSLFPTLGPTTEFWKSPRLARDRIDIIRPFLSPH